MLLQECGCGEPLLDDRRACPECGASNPRYRPSRWRTFWPDADSLAGSTDAIQLGYWAAFLAAGLGVVTSLIPAFGVGPSGLCDAALFALCGAGIWRKWRAAAVIGLLLSTANIVYSISRGGGVGILAVLIFVGLVNGVRGTFVHARLSHQAQAVGEAG